MAARKKDEQDAGAASSDESNGTAGKSVAPMATTDALPTYRTDLGESLPPQKHAGVE